LPPGAQTVAALAYGGWLTVNGNFYNGICGSKRAIHGKLTGESGGTDAATLAAATRICPLPIQQSRERGATTTVSDGISWRRTLGVGLVLYVVGLVIFGLTGNRNLFPALMLL